MPIQCTFKLNGKSSSVLVCPGIGSFSGTGKYVDDPKSTSVSMEGPLPTGQYYIYDRGSGGLVTLIKDWSLKTFHHTDRTKWFALFRDDGRIDDTTYVNSVPRKFIRLHPNGPWGLSEGCLTLFHQSDFDKLAAYLHKQGPKLPTKAGMAYGVIEVTQ